MTSSNYPSLIIENMQLALGCLRHGQTTSATLLLGLALSGLDRRVGSESARVKPELASFYDERYKFLDEMIDTLFHDGGAS